MKSPKHLTHIVLIAVATLSLLSVSSAQPQRKIRVACIGDSITEGYGAEVGKSYPSQLQEILGNKYEVSNFGISGRTLLSKGDYPYINETIYRKAIDYKADIIIILLGTNDTKPQNWRYFSEFMADYKALITSFRATDTKPVIYICRPCPAPGAGNFGINNKNINEEIRVLDLLVRQEHLHSIDMYSALVNKPELLPDRVHPNTAGAKEMAIAAARAIAKNRTLK